MPDKPKLFSDFSPVTKSEWLRKVEKDLKGKPIDSLNWELEEGVRLSPFFHQEDLRDNPIPLSSAQENNDWEIGEYVAVEEIAEANGIALEALNGGAEALGFQLYHPLNAKSLSHLLQDIDLRMISTNFGEMYVDKYPWELLGLVINYAEEKGYDLAEIEGSIDFDPILDWSTPPMEEAVETFKKAAEALPLFKILQINGTYYHAGDLESSRELALITAKFSAYLNQLISAGLPADDIVNGMQVSVSLSTNYFVEIAKIRALKILLGNVAKQYGCKRHFVPQIVAHLAKESQTDNPNTNMIQATTQAMAAVIAGVDRLYVLSANTFTKEPSTSFTRRIARNAQHLLKMEGFMDKVSDPAAGSYYIEKLTSILAERAWTQFQQLETEGAFEIA